MRGLPFPADPTYREPSFDYDTPLTTVDNIAIDPALASPAIDPAILAQENAANVAVFNAPPPQDPSTSQYRTQYSPGPQGDPFAPPPPPVFVPELSNMPTPKPVKKKRKPRREEECGFCQGDDSNNKCGHPEVMVSCVECGRSGHPTCMELGKVADVIRSYPWTCLECKTCEICREKGDDERILFCDFCDRGWHMDCLQPPITEPPPGAWHCPLCPPVEFFVSNDPTTEESHFREESVASTSYSQEAPQIINNTRRKGKSKAGNSETGTTSKRRRGKTSKVQMSDTDHDEITVSSTRPIKRMKLKVPSPPRMVVRLRIPPNRGKGKAREEEEEEPKGLFEDILAPEDRDTTRTTVEAWDKSRYEKSRTAAEVKLFPANPPTLPPLLETDHAPGPSSRPLRSSYHPTIQIPSTPGPAGSPAPSTPGGYPGKTLQPSSTTPALRIRTIRFGEFDIQTWYDAPFPEEYANLPDGRLWLCEFCLKYMRSQFLSIRHRTKCRMRHPPGDEIYRDGAVSVFEVDGRKNKIYCQNLCLLSKMFLDHKSLFYDVEPFLFYVITETDEIGARFVGYFSKEKRSPKDYNVSCIMTLPVRQRKGWGNLLIDFSYLLSKKEKRVGSPEKPLSALGALGYRNYWTLALMRYLDTAPEGIRLEDISKSTCMTIEDICATLTQQGMLTKRDLTPPVALVRPSPGQSIKITRGRKNGIARRHLQRKQTTEEEGTNAPFVIPVDYEIVWDKQVVRAYLDKWEAKGYLKLKPERLKWSPFIMVRTKKSETLALPSGAEEIGTVATPEVTSSNTLSTTNTSNLDTLSAVADALRENAPIPNLFSEDEISEVSQMDQDNGLSAKQVDRTPVPAITRIRSQDTPSKQQKVNSSPITRRSRSRSAVPITELVEDDGAFAAKLASEEARSRRPLRSRSSTSGVQELTRAASSVPIPGRKRRRVESSPEPETSPLLPIVELDIHDEHENEPSVHHGHNGWPSEPVKVNGRAPISLLEVTKVHHRPSPLKEQLTLDIPDFENAKDEADDEMQDPDTPLTALTSRLSELGDDKNSTPATVEEAVKGEQDVVMGDDQDAEGDLDEDAEGEPDSDEVDYT